MLSKPTAVQVSLSFQVPFLRLRKAVAKASDEHMVNIAAINAASNGRQGDPVCDLEEATVLKISLIISRCKACRVKLKKSSIEIQQICSVRGDPL